MSHLMSTIHQRTVSDADLISWITKHAPEGLFVGDRMHDRLRNNIASHYKVSSAFDCFDERAEHITITGVYNEQV